MQIDRDKANAELARFTGCNHAETPDFLCGLLPDGSCDEAQVNGDLLGRLVLRLKERVWLWWDGSEWVGEATDGDEVATHAHPVAALYLALKDAGLVERSEG